MSVAEIYIERAARQMMKRYNTNALFEAALRADAAYEDGDMFNFDTWTRVTEAITALEAISPVSTSGH